MSNNKKSESVTERLERMKREKAASKTVSGTTEIINDLSNDSAEDLDFAVLAKRLMDRKEQEWSGDNEDYRKMTIYIRNDIADTFNALLTKRGQQKEFANIAFADFVKKKAKELGLLDK